VTLKQNKKGAKVAALQETLISLGYNLAVDGVFGQATEASVKAFQTSSGIAADGIVGHFTEMALFNAINHVEIIKPSSEHFAYEDFISEYDKAAMANGIPYQYWDNIQTMMDRLEVIREAIGNLDLVIRSGYRSTSYNKAVRGSLNSQHLLGKAVDIFVANRALSCYDLAKAVFFNDELKKLFGGYGLGSDTNLHVDIRKRSNPLKSVTWWYGKKSWKEWGK